MRNFFDHDNALPVYYVGLYKNITKAAEKLNLTQSAMSRRIISAEERTGIQIFERRFHNMYPTKAGKIYIEACKNIVHQGDAALKAAHEVAGNSKNELRIVTTPSMANTWLPRVLANFGDEHPELTIHIVTDINPVDVLQSDIMINTFQPDSPDLEQIKIFDQVQGLFASQKYIEKHGEPHSLEELENHRLLALDPNIYEPHDHANWILNVGLMNNKHRKAFMTFTSNDARYNAMKEGIGITTCGIHQPKLFQDNVIQVLKDRNLERIGLYFSYNKIMGQVSKYEILLDYISNHIQKNKKIYQD